LILAGGSGFGALYLPLREIHFHAVLIGAYFTT